MGGTPDIGTALSQLLQQSGGAPPAPQSNTSPMAGILSQAMQHLSTTPYQPTPAGGGGIDPSLHPVLAKAIQTLASGAGAFGWTAMPPQERLERTQMEQQKAETMARLAQTGVMQEQTSLWRAEQAETARERARAYEEDVKSKKEARETQAQIAKDRLDVQRDMAEVRKALGEGRLQVAHAQLDQRAEQFEKMFRLRAQQVGIEQAKLDLMEQGNAIKQGFLDVARGALSQRGALGGAELVQKYQTLQLERPILSQFFGLDDVSRMVSESRGAQIPGVPVPATGVASGATGAPGTTPTPSRPTTPAKTAPRAKSGSTIIRYDAQGNRLP